MEMNEKAEAFEETGEAEELESSYPITRISLDRVTPYKKHPFKVIEDVALEQLAEDIKSNGLINPIVVREICFTQEYEILSGHRRVTAAKKLGWTEIDAHIIFATDTEAANIVISSNFKQRDKILPSERAKSYQLRNECLKKAKSGSNSHGGNSDENSTTDIMEKEFNESKSSLFRYMRLNYLIDELIDLTDSDVLTIVNAAELSYFPKLQQQLIYQFFFVDKKAMLNKALIKKMREYELTLTEEILEALTTTPKKEKKSFDDEVVTRYRKYFEDDEAAIKKILEILDAYFADYEPLDASADEEDEEKTSETSTNANRPKRKRRKKKKKQTDGDTKTSE